MAKFICTNSDCGVVGEAEGTQVACPRCGSRMQPITDAQFQALRQRVQQDQAAGQNAGAGNGDTDDRRVIDVTGWFGGARSAVGGALGTSVSFGRMSMPIWVILLLAIAAFVFGPKLLQGSRPSLSTTYKGVTLCTTFGNIPVGSEINYRLKVNPSTGEIDPNVVLVSQRGEAPANCVQVTSGKYAGMTVQTWIQQAASSSSGIPGFLQEFGQQEGGQTGQSMNIQGGLGAVDDGQSLNINLLGSNFRVYKILDYWTPEDPAQKSRLQILMVVIIVAAVLEVFQVTNVIQLGQQQAVQTGWDPIGAVMTLLGIIAGILVFSGSISPIGGFPLFLFSWMFQLNLRPVKSWILAVLGFGGTFFLQWIISNIPLLAFLSTVDWGVKVLEIIMMLILFWAVVKRKEVDGTVSSSVIAVQAVLMYGGIGFWGTSWTPKTLVIILVGLALFLASSDFEEEKWSALFVVAFAFYLPAWALSEIEEINLKDIVILKFPTIFIGLIYTVVVVSVIGGALMDRVGVIKSFITALGAWTRRWQRLGPIIISVDIYLPMFIMAILLIILGWAPL